MGLTEKPVVLYRAWRVREDGLLCSVAQNYEWKPFDDPEAECIQPDGEKYHEDGMTVPVWGCSCGFYGFIGERALIECLDYAQRRWPIVFGRVEAGGHYVKAETGYRVQHAYPQVLYYGPGPVAARGEIYASTAAVRTAAAAYGVEILPMPQSLASALDKELVRRLADESERETRLHELLDVINPHTGGCKAEGIVKAEIECSVMDARVAFKAGTRLRPVGGGPSFKVVNVPFCSWTRTENAHNGGRAMLDVRVAAEKPGCAGNIAAKSFMLCGTHPGVKVTRLEGGPMTGGVDGGVDKLKFKAALAWTLASFGFACVLVANYVKWDRFSLPMLVLEAVMMAAFAMNAPIPWFRR